ncbi:MAG: hypothetical protein KIB00_16250 [Paeniclostridium sordellii]|uniref:hypothetical protein n=1 Tax=Paraclostridium sordellii TaxID=1505 RepID=UPI000542B104|nr:hypothetical protein [Paeniclostridium sordellii]MBS6025628.1 hypothetical protein [Paeniclostridium sordellii]CEK35757.1 hypothetical protein UMC2_26501 [[Clostridium] sordellii] [Paeniclostridium sordellii]
MKIKKLLLATGEEFEDAEFLDLDYQGGLDEEAILGIPLLKLKIDKKEVLINKDYILTLELPKLQTV